MKRLIDALSQMPVVKLQGDRDPVQVGARRAVMARLCSVIQKSRHEGGGPTQGRRLFTKDEGIALGVLFFLAMREIGMHDVVARSEELGTELHERLLQAPLDHARLDETTEGELLDAAEQLSDGVVAQLEYATGDLW